MKIVQTRLRRFSPASLLAAAASNQATLALLASLALGVVIYYRVSFADRLWFVVVPALLLILNFLLALVTRNILKNNWPLMIFHFALVALVLLLVAGQMTYFRGTLELAQNEVFSGKLENVSQGPWHRFGLGQTRFVNLGFQIRYNTGIRRDTTRNQVAVTSADGSRQVVEIGDHVPLIIGHYRFYTSHNKGYAPVFEWRPAGSPDVVTGSIHLPAFPVHEFRQALEWRIPRSDIRLWTLLKIEDELLPEDRAFEFRLPRQHRVVIRFLEKRYELEPGDEISLPEGALGYRGLSTWMGYKVDYDWTRPWLLATALVGLAALFLHYLRKFSLVGSSLVAEAGNSIASLPQMPRS